MRAAQLSHKLLEQGYDGERLKQSRSTEGCSKLKRSIDMTSSGKKLSLRKFYGRYGIIKQYKVSLSQRLHCILGHDHILKHPPSIRHFTKSWPCTALDLITDFDLIIKFREVWIGYFATDAVRQQKMLTPPDTLSCPNLFVRFLLNLSCLRTLNIGHPSVFLFCFWPCVNCLFFITIFLEIPVLDTKHVLDLGQMWHLVHSLFSACSYTSSCPPKFHLVDGKCYSIGATQLSYQESKVWWVLIMWIYLNTSSRRRLLLLICVLVCIFCWIIWVCPWENLPYGILSTGMLSAYKGFTSANHTFLRKFKYEMMMPMCCILVCEA